MSVVECLREDFGYSSQMAAAIWKEFLNRNDDSWEMDLPEEKEQETREIYFD